MQHQLRVCSTSITFSLQHFVQNSECVRINQSVDAWQCNKVINKQTLGLQEDEISVLIELCVLLYEQSPPFLYPWAYLIIFKTEYMGLLVCINVCSSVACFPVNASVCILEGIGKIRACEVALVPNNRFEEEDVEVKCHAFYTWFC